MPWRRGDFTSRSTRYSERVGGCYPRLAANSIRALVFAFADRPRRRYRQPPPAGGSILEDTTMPGANGSLGGLVDVDRGLVSREIFVSEEIYRQEQEQVFARAWLFIGHESQIPRPGDF